VISIGIINDGVLIISSIGMEPKEEADYQAIDLSRK
jgi:hypothetical protein